MSYNPNKPDAGPSPAVDTTTLKSNFASYATLFANNHIAMNLANQGDHGQVIFTLQSADPGISQNLDVLYAKNATQQSGQEPQLFVQIPKFLPNNVPNSPMQLTYNAVNTGGPMYQSFLPGGYLLYMGSTTNIAANIVLSPTPTQILAAWASSNVLLTTAPATRIINSSTFKIDSANTGVYIVYWFAIAKA